MTGTILSKKKNSISNKLIMPAFCLLTEERKYANELNRVKCLDDQTSMHVEIFDIVQHFG